MEALMPYLTDEPEDPGPRAPFEERERYKRAHERWLMRDTPGTALDRLERNHRKLMDLHSPIRAALWLALMKPSEDLFERENDVIGGEQSIPAVIAMAESAVRKAIRGDMTAFNSIADRIEGKVGLRKGDVDPELDSKQAEIAGVVEGVVTALTKAKLDGTIPEPFDGEVEDITPVSERPIHDPRTEREG
jgi:hypothetical protein